MRRRDRRTRRSVYWTDRLARTLIRVGGIGTIAAISTVCLFLFWVVWPLLRGESAGAAKVVGGGYSAQRLLAMAPDETFSTLWAWTSDNRFLTFAAADGSRLGEHAPFEQAPTAFAFPLNSPRAIFGFADGSARLVRIESATSYRDDVAMPVDLREKPRGERFLFEGKVAERVGERQFALREVSYAADAPLAISPDAAIHAIDLSITSNGPAFASIDTKGVLRVSLVSTRPNFMTGGEEASTESGELLLEAVASRGLPKWVLLRGLGDNAFAIWEDGHAVRVDARSLGSLKVAEEIDLLPGSPGSAAGSPRISAIAFLNAKNTIVVGDTHGGLHAWFRVPAPAMTTSDGAHFISAHELAPTGSAADAGSALTALAASPRTRLLAAADAGGRLRIYHVTSGRLVAETKSEGKDAVSALALAADDRHLLAWNGQLEAVDLDAPHPEVSWRALLRPVFYEGYPAPAHVWQSSSGSDDFEPKLGLWPLVFGTIKATFYSMLFGVPIALMAAIYTSEFLRPEVKAVVKPAIEMMASLPSVVLGFLAALVLAPMVEGAVAELLCATVLVPFALLAAAHLWQLLPGGRRASLQGLRFLLAAFAILVGALAASFAGPVVERVLFGGDLHRWLDGGAGGALGGWLVFGFPSAAVAAFVLVRRFGESFLATTVSPAVGSLVLFLVGSLLTLPLAWAAAALLAAAGFDLRGSVVDTYVQRNALVVGFVMAFAIIPIIYTIAEDALSSIPENLRAGSLALGATPWQTALRIVIPTAMSGLFSAIMIGLGRAVGETMIVLMAAGNTPVLDWNIFNGFRTLSANIAVELPEAVRNGTHYRTLFLAAFTLFLMTFVLNTAAELVRSRFRKRARQL